MASVALADSLSKMSVFTDEDPRNQALLMPKLQYRFRVTFENFGAPVGGDTPATLTRQVVDVTRPTLTFGEVTLPVYNSTIYLAGKHTWNPITINIRDDALGTVSRIIGGQMQKQLDMVQQSSAFGGQDYKFSMRIEMLDGGNGAYEPIALEVWDLGGCYVQSTSYNNLSYGSSEAVAITMSIRYDNAIQVRDEELIGVGIDVGRTRNDDATGLGSGGVSTSQLAV